MLCAPLDISTSKFIVMVVKSSSKSKTYFCLIFFTKLSWTSIKKFFWDGNYIHDINAYKAFLAIHFQQTVLVSYFWQPIDQDLP
jgi:hypothetical protein